MCIVLICLCRNLTAWNNLELLKHGIWCGWCWLGVCVGMGVSVCEEVSGCGWAWSVCTGVGGSDCACSHLLPPFECKCKDDCLWTCMPVCVNVCVLGGKRKRRGHAALRLLWLLTLIIILSVQCKYWHPYRMPSQRPMSALHSMLLMMIFPLLLSDTVQHHKHSLQLPRCSVLTYVFIFATASICLPHCTSRSLIIPQLFGESILLWRLIDFKEPGCQRACHNRGKAQKRGCVIGSGMAVFSPLRWHVQPVWQIRAEEPGQQQLITHTHLSHQPSSVAERWGLCYNDARVKNSEVGGSGQGGLICLTKHCHALYHEFFHCCHYLIVVTNIDT